MSVDVDGTTIETFKGDTCSITFTNLEEGMLIYLGVRDIRTDEPIFDEISGIVDSEGEITFTLTPTMTNKFEVNPTAGVNTYLYGVKQVDEVSGEENTILLGNNPVFGDKYYLKVYAKKVEGIVEDND